MVDTSKLQASESWTGIVSLACAMFINSQIVLLVRMKDSDLQTCELLVLSKHFGVWGPVQGSSCMQARKVGLWGVASIDRQGTSSLQVQIQRRKFEGGALQALLMHLVHARLHVTRMHAILPNLVSADASSTCKILFEYFLESTLPMSCTPPVTPSVSVLHCQWTWHAIDFLS